MGRGSSKAGGRSAGGGTASKKDQDAFVERIAKGMANPSPDETPMSSGDVQSVVEAYAIEHGLSAQDEDRLADAIRDRANEIERKSAQSQPGTTKAVSVPTVSPQKMAHMDRVDLEKVYKQNVIAKQMEMGMGKRQAIKIANERARATNMANMKRYIKQAQKERQGV